MLYDSLNTTGFVGIIYVNLSYSFGSFYTDWPNITVFKQNDATFSSKY